MIGFVLPLLLASAALPADDIVQVERQVSEIYRPYAAEVNEEPSWERTVFSQETAALIAHWQSVMPEDEPDELNDGDWFCECQDWDQRGFAATAGQPELMTDGRVEVDAKVDLGFGDEGGVRDMRLIFKREEAGWTLDDLFGESFPRGLKEALRETIAADEARRTRAVK